MLDYMRCRDQQVALIRAFFCVSALAIVPSVAEAQSATYKYDELGRLQTVDHPNGLQSTYTYDLADNRTGTTVGTPGGNTGPQTLQVTSVGNLRQIANAAGYNGAAPGNYIFVVASAVSPLIGAAGSNNNVAIDTGSWPSGSTLSLSIAGKVYGYGGAGGAGGTSNTSPQTAGARGGDAILAQYPITITVTGELKGGGGGGAGGTAALQPTPYNPKWIGGGGGGGGFPNGPGGLGGVAPGGNGSNGGNGTLTSGGTAGASYSGQAGVGGYPGVNNSGSVGSFPGGAPGYAVKLQGVTITCPTGSNVQGGCGT